MQLKILIFSLFLVMFNPSLYAFGIGLVPLHSNNVQVNKPYGSNITLEGTPLQIKNLKKWINIIASVPKGLNTLIKIQQSQHKLFLFHSPFALISSGRTSAPATSNLINGNGESVDIYFNAEIPDSGSHQVLNSSGKPIEYTAVQNLYHELAHAEHMMNGTWRYFKSEIQAIEEENIFRKQFSEYQNKPFYERIYVKGLPICPSSSEFIDYKWFQELICKP